MSKYRIKKIVRNDDEEIFIPQKKGLVFWYDCSLSRFYPDGFYSEEKAVEYIKEAIEEEKASAVKYTRYIPF